MRSLCRWREKGRKGDKRPGRRKEKDRNKEQRAEEGRERKREGRYGSLARPERAYVVRRTHACDTSYVRYRSIRQFAIYCLDFNLQSEWPWALPPLPTDIRRRKLPIVSMELDSYCAPTFMPQQRERASERACTHECIIITRVRSFGKPTTKPRTLWLSQKRQSVGISTISRFYRRAHQPPRQIYAAERMIALTRKKRG